MSGFENEVPDVIGADTRPDQDADGVDNYEPETAENETQQAAPEEEPAEEHPEEGAEEVEAKAEDEVEEENQEPVEKPAKPAAKNARSQERIQQLNARAKAAEQAAQQTQQVAEQRHQQLLQHFNQQLQTQQKHFEQQLELQRKQVEMSERRYAEEQEAKLSPEDRITKKFYEEAAARAEEKLSPKLKELQDKYEAAEKEKAHFAEQYRRQQSAQQLIAEATQVNKSTFGDLLDSEALRPFAPVLDELALTYSTAAGGTTQEAAKYLQGFAEAYHKAKLKAISSGKGSTKVQQNQKAPGVLPKARVQANGQINWPTRNELNKQGYDSHAAWYADQVRGQARG